MSLSGRDPQSVLDEVDDAFVQQTYVLFEVGEGWVAFNTRDIRSVEAEPG